MAIPCSKTELLGDIESTYRKLREDIETIPADRTDRKEMPGHVRDTKMSVCNLLAYLIGWGNLVLKWHEISLQGRMPDLPDTGFRMNELGRLALKFYDDYENDSFEDLAKKLDEVVGKVIGMVKSMDNDELYGEAWHGKYPFGRMVQFNTSSPYKNARSRIRKWKKDTGIM